MTFKNIISKGLVLLVLLNTPGCSENTPQYVTPQTNSSQSSQKSPEEKEQEKLLKEIESLKNEKLKLENTCLKYRNESLDHENDILKANEKRNANHAVRNGVVEHVGFEGLVSALDRIQVLMGEVVMYKKRDGAWQKLFRDQGYNPEEVIRLQINPEGTALDYLKDEARWKRTEAEYEADKESWRADAANWRRDRASMWKTMANHQRRIAYTEDRLKRYEPGFSYFSEVQDNSGLDFLIDIQRKTIELQNQVDFYELNSPKLKEQYKKTKETKQKAPSTSINQ